MPRNSEEVTSSPDPLNDTPAFQAHRTRAAKARQSLPARGGNSPSKQTFELDVSNQLSPRKIRVTVEAGSDIENAMSPTRHAPVNRRGVMTTTTTVPVRGLSDTEDDTTHVATPKRGRGRPRKSTGTPVKKRGRASTPTQKGRRESIGSLVGDDSEDRDFHLGKGVEVGRVKGRSRSRSRSGNGRKSTPANKQAESEKKTSSTTNKKGRGRRKSLLPDEVETLEDSSGDKSQSQPESEITDALASVDINTSCPPSQYSTIRSTTTVSSIQPDVTLARFDPDNETPHKLGWSSPRIVEDPQGSNTSEEVRHYPSPSTSAEKTNSKRGESVDMTEAQSAIAETQGPSTAEESQDEGDYYPEGNRDDDDSDDDPSQHHEFDTILESEGFSMISVDSVPSLREQRSSPAVPAQKRSELEPPKNKKLHSVQEDTANDDSFSIIPDDILEAATPGRKTLPSKNGPVQQSHMDDSFSKAAAPPRETQASRFLSDMNAQTEDSFSSIPSDILEAATPGRQLTKLKTPEAASTQGHEAYEDSFSAIPSAILGAASPKKQQQDSISGPAPEQLSVSNRAQTRLPTPEKTPSPPKESSVEESDLQDNISKGKAPEQLLEGNSTMVNSYIKSSPPVIPPRYTYTAHFRQQRILHPDTTQTPSIVFSSPSLPPLKQGPVAGKPEQVQRKHISPVVQASRVLQKVVVPSSPRERSQSLRSPFKSPISGRRSTVSIGGTHDEATLSHEKLFPRLNLAGKLFSSARRGQGAKNDDPFSSTIDPPRPTTSAERPMYSLDLPSTSVSNSRLSDLRMEEQSEDAMSWQSGDEIALDNNVEQSITNEGPSKNDDSQTSIDNTKSWEERLEAERAAVRRQISAANSSQVVVINSDDDDSVSGDQQDEESELPGNEELGLLMETIISSSPAMPQHQEPLKVDDVEKPRRSKIPSPWRQNSKRLVYSDELSSHSPPKQHFSAKVDMPNSTANRAVSQPKPFQPAKPSQQSNVDFDITSFSPAHIPQKANFQPRARNASNLDLSALLATSPVKGPVLSKPSSSKESEKNRSDADKLGENSNSVGSTQLKEFAPIPQKMGFTPRARQPSNPVAPKISSPAKQPMALARGMFGNMPARTIDQPTPEPSSSTTKPLSISSPSKSDTLFIQKTPTTEQSPPYEDGSSVSTTSSEDQGNRAIHSRTRRWTGGVSLHTTAPIPLSFTSPTKSCLRSPLKTPQRTDLVSPSKSVAFVSSSPIPQEQPLSSTTWSRQHWLFLDSIIEAWKPENQKPGSAERERRRNNTRVISSLLGKYIRNGDDRLKMEQWNLEAVDEFRGKVPGWDEIEIARRVFALIVGAEKRAKGLVTPRAELAA